MHKRFWLSIAMLAIGASMLAATALGSAGKAGSSNAQQARNGGTVRPVLALDIENVDPARSYYVPEWQYEWLTGRMLLNYAHKAGKAGYRQNLDGAKSYKVSKDGKTYTFNLRHGMKFSDGKPITAANYRWSLLRILNPGVQSPGASFLTDPASVNIVGALAYNTNGKPAPAGITTKGKYTLVVKLQKSSPLLLSLLALPFTTAEPTGFPMEPIVKVPFGNFKQLPSGGRYYIASRTPNRSLVIKKNPFYKPLGAVPTPGHVAQFNYTMGVEANQELLLLKKGQADWPADGGLDPSVWGGLFKQYGTKGRARAISGSCVAYASMNTQRAAFSSIAARKSINYGFNRKAFVTLDGAHGGNVTSQLLTPPVPGYKKATIYPSTPNLSKAKSFAKGHTGAKIELWHSSTQASILRAQLLESNLKAIGYNNIEQKTIASGFYTQIGKRGTSYDIARVGWCMDFPDPYDYINKLLSGDGIQDAQNVNWPYFNVKAANVLMRKAANQRPPKRYTTYGNLDIKLLKKWAPIAPYELINDRYFFSSRIDTKSIKTSNIYELDLGQLALK